MTRSSEARVARRKTNPARGALVMTQVEKRDVAQYAQAFKARTGSSLVLTPLMYDAFARCGVDMTNFHRQGLIPQ